MKVLIEYAKGKRFRKVKVVIHSKDLWSGDTTLAHIIHPMLVKYRNYYNGKNPMKGIPASMFDDFLNADNPQEQHDAAENEALKRWINCLDTMIYAFRWNKQDSIFGPYAKEIHAELGLQQKLIKKLRKQEDEETEQKGFCVDRCVDIYAPIFDKWKSELEKHDEKVKEGLRLFGEHFQSLWT